MTAAYRSLMFGDAVKAAQAAHGSRAAYSREDGHASESDRFTEAEAQFLSERDSFYMATVGSGGWPYIQHRGGPPGFIKILSDRSFAVPDFRGNRQFISLGNLSEDDRAAFFFMDQVNRRRLKLIGRARMMDLDAAPDLSVALALHGYKATVERMLVVDVEAFDWNCPQHIPQRFTYAEIAPAIDALKARIAELEDQLAAVSAVKPPG